MSKKFTIKVSTIDSILICILIIFSIDLLENFSPIIISNTVIYIYEMIILLYFLILRKVNFDKMFGVLIFFALYVTIVTTIGYWGDSNFLSQVTYALYIVLLPLVGYLFAINSTKDSLKLMFYILYFLILVCIFYSFITEFGNILSGNRAESFLDHPITYGTIVAMGIFMTSYLFSNIWLKIIFYLIFLLAAISSFSRSSWVAIVFVFVISMGPNLLKKMKTKITRKTFYRGLILFGLIIMLCIIFRSNISEIWSMINNRLSGTMDSVSAAQRLGTIAYFASTLDIFDILFGNGFGKAGDFLGSTATIAISGFDTTDNQYVTILYDFGIWIFILTVILIIRVFKHIISPVEDRQIRMVSQVVMAGMACAFFYEIMGWMNVATILLLFIGIFCCLSRKSVAKKKSIQEEAFCEKTE